MHVTHVLIGGLGSRGLPASGPSCRGANCRSGPQTSKAGTRRGQARHAWPLAFSSDNNMSY
eukprot:7664284-Karenia_brevis.AAC.1